MNLVPNKPFQAFALIVDLNGFTTMVDGGETDLIADFIRDSLSGSIRAIQENHGEVVGFMGDALFGVLGEAQDVVNTCFDIAKDLDRTCEWISNQQEGNDNWSFAPGGPSLKIGFEWGLIDASEIRSRKLGTVPLLIGTPINHASRILGAGEGNRCLCGPNAAKKLNDAGYRLDGPTPYRSPKDQRVFTYFELDLGDIWVAGPRSPGDDTFSG